VLSGEIRPEIARKESRNFRPEYCFHVPLTFPCIPAVSRRTSLTWEGILSYYNLTFL
jgi:hypothetical protein